MRESDNGELEFLTKCEGYTDRHNTWERKETFNGNLSEFEMFSLSMMQFIQTGKHDLDSPQRLRQMNWQRSFGVKDAKAMENQNIINSFKIVG